jgi:hypothetical protein
MMPHTVEVSLTNTASSTVTLADFREQIPFLLESEFKQREIFERPLSNTDFHSKYCNFLLNLLNSYKIFISLVTIFHWSK